jgi:hypothetical protein
MIWLAYTIFRLNSFGVGGDRTAVREAADCATGLGKAQLFKRETISTQIPSSSSLLIYILSVLYWRNVSVCRYLFQHLNEVKRSPGVAMLSQNESCVFKSVHYVILGGTWPSG